MAESPKQRLLRIFKERAFSFGQFTLASGKTSTYYINSKKAIFHSETAWLLGETLYEATADLQVEAAGGLEVGAIPLAAVLAAPTTRRGGAWRGFSSARRRRGTGARNGWKGSCGRACAWPCWTTC